MTTVAEILEELGSRRDDQALAGMAKFGIRVDKAYYVRKAVNWALRNIGKRDVVLNVQAVESARRIAASGTKAGRWIAADALRELESDVVRHRLGL